MTRSWLHHMYIVPCACIITTIIVFIINRSFFIYSDDAIMIVTFYHIRKDLSQRHPDTPRTPQDSGKPLTAIICMHVLHVDPVNPVYFSYQPRGPWTDIITMSNERSRKFPGLVVCTCAGANSRQMISGHWLHRFDFGMNSWTDQFFFQRDQVPFKIVKVQSWITQTIFRPELSGNPLISKPPADRSPDHSNPLQALSFQFDFPSRALHLDMEDW